MWLSDENERKILNTAQAIAVWLGWWAPGSHPTVTGALRGVSAAILTLPLLPLYAMATLFILITLVSTSSFLEKAQVRYIDAVSADVPLVTQTFIDLHYQKYAYTI